MQYTHPVHTDSESHEHACMYILSWRKHWKCQEVNYTTNKLRQLPHL